MTATRFIAFYSHKGGVGRSLALTNTAYLLAKAGRKVLIIDFDLEAPGQHLSELFKPRHLDEHWPGEGLVELLHRFLAFRKAITNKRDAPISEQIFKVELERYIRTAAPFREYLSGLVEQEKIDKNSQGSLSLLPAGACMSTEYSHLLESLNWPEFYKEHGATFLRLLKHSIRTLGFDDVLIDSRTGLSDVFYIATLELAETVVCVSGFNTQNILGIKNAIEVLQSEQVTQAYGEKRIVLVGSPDPDSLTQSERAHRMQLIRQEWPGFKDFGLTLPYVPELALYERILCWEADKTGQHNVYTRAIDTLLTQLDNPIPFWQPKQEEEVKPTHPFSLIRNDYITSSDVVRYFVDPAESVLNDMASFMPLIVTGARGSGKTMLANRFSFDVWVAERQNKGMPINASELDQIGLYFRIDADFLHAFHQEDEKLQQDFNRLFAQFFDIVVIRKALKALDALGGIGNWLSDEGKLYSALCAEFGEFDKVIGDYEELTSFMERQLQRIRYYLNNPSADNRPVVIQPNVLMKLLVEHLKRGEKFGKHYFSILLDEYENYADYQQIIINTRLKQSKREDCVTYRLFMRHGGLRLRETLAPQQYIEETHDYRAHSLDEGLDFDTFKLYAVAVANRHLELSPFFSNKGLNQIELLLEDLDAEEEARLLARGKRQAPLEKWVSDNFPNDAAEIIKWLKTETSPLRQATAIVIMNQGKYIPDVITAFTEDSKIAKDWYHNYHRGALHWLCRLYHQDKRYAGLNQLIGLSGNNIRVFLDFCHEIVSDWFADNAHALPISWEIQNTAINNQARIYRENLRSSDRTCKEIINFLDRLGRIFEAAHKSPKQSEPEINHFSVKGDFSTSEDKTILEKLLQTGWYIGILRKLPGNKQKSLKDLRLDDWQLSPWFAPLFGLSTRRKKKLVLSGEEAYLLFQGCEADWNDLFSKFNKRFEASGDELSDFSDQKQRQLI
jgi:cellulose biosynthesis protein BcsQ